MSPGARGVGVGLSAGLTRSLWSEGIRGGLSKGDAMKPETAKKKADDLLERGDAAGDT